MSKKLLIGVAALTLIVSVTAFAKAYLAEGPADAEQQTSLQRRHLTPEVKEATIGDVQIFLRITGLASGEHGHGEHEGCEHMKSEGDAEAKSGTGDCCESHRGGQGKQAMTSDSPRIMVALLHKGTHPLRNTSVRAQVTSDVGTELLKLRYDPKGQLYSAPLTMPHTGAGTVRVLFTAEEKDFYVIFDYPQILNDT